MAWNRKHNKAWDAPIEEFQQYTDRELADKYGCSVPLVCRARIRKTGVKRQIKTDLMSGEEIHDTYEVRVHDVEHMEKELRQREYERSRAAGGVWQRGDDLNSINPALRVFIEKNGGCGRAL
jgi:hypothetical protein